MKQIHSPDLAQAARKKRSWLRFLPAIIWMAVIFILSSRTGDDLDSVMPWFQKIFPGMESFDSGHFLEYFILALTFDYAIGSKGDRIVWKVIIVSLCALYGVSDEFHQSFVPRRSPDINDVRNDAIGAALAVIVIAIPPIRKFWRKLAS
ncbi:VanZ family protein [Paenibacillus sp. GCM10027626]|uniref:VanZ family protein n=1 Tax=Paenibacillus sp. GCM10027626 TaxID=3273411 RepID=UPI0036255350